MGVRKDSTKGGKWLAEFYHDGKRVRKWFATKGEATRFFNQEQAKNATQSENVRVVLSNDLAPLSHYAHEWYELYGQTLNDGQARLNKLLNLCSHLGDPPANKFTTQDFAEYRKKRLAGKFSADPKRPPKQSTVNREHAYLRAVFNELKSLGKWSGDNPLSEISLFKENETELAFLFGDEIRRLIDECDNSRNKDLGLITRICLATGARWSEAEQLKQAQVIPYKITYINTKSGKNRTIPISPELYNMLPQRRGRLFGDAYEAFENAVDRAGIDLPKGQLTHVLRHTFASHFMMNGGNILVLKEILGHSTIEMTMKYAHFAPSHLESAVSLNPLTNPSKKR
ncbi:site-specific integrase [Pasteurella multocida]|uniref:Integrase n=3 Tax=root TaxID=1 RepID=A0AAE9WWD7_9CAUD|nr:site-specific integrase [Pasteurella multocida]WBY65450.1 integrase [Pasteurella phage vB_PmuM_CFP3]MBF6980619.1 site-specific integrase [Pasteurella multocida]MBF6983257.1 site-specific integrase [Pasteurella multocida]MCL7832900.1 site-specific integrase [Pasteurella multocida]MDA5611119.1 site-specific integrase [Pasteurella multocida]